MGSRINDRNLNILKENQFVRYISQNDKLELVGRVVGTEDKQAIVFVPRGEIQNLEETAEKEYGYDRGPQEHKNNKYPASLTFKRVPE